MRLKLELLAHCFEHCWVEAVVLGILVPAEVICQVIVLASDVFCFCVDGLSLEALPSGSDDVVHCLVLAALEPAPMAG